MLTRIFSMWKNVAFCDKWNLFLAEVTSFGNRDKWSPRDKFSPRKHPLRTCGRGERARGSAPLYIDRAKIVNFQWQLSTPLSRTLHAISAPLKISAGVWSAKFHTDASCREKSFEATTRAGSEYAFVYGCMCARSVRFTWFNSSPWLRYLTF